MSYFTKPSVDSQIRLERSLATDGLELAYDLNLDEVMAAGGQGDVFRAERKDDKLLVAIKVTRRSKLLPGPEGVHSEQLTTKRHYHRPYHVAIESPA
jgi:serine/threonine protein kinase